MADANLTAAQLREIFHYDPSTGVFTRRVTVSHNARAGAVVGYRYASVYLGCEIRYKPYLLHRLAWLYVYGAWPDGQIDHKNGDTIDNRINNLREATNSENHQNRVAKKNGSSRYLGVYWSKAMCKWGAKIGVNYKQIHLGFHETEELASKAYLSAKADRHTFNPEVRQ